LLRLPGWFLQAGQANAWGAVLLTALLAGGLHSWLAYSLSVFALHEGAAHNVIFPPRGPVSRVANFLANNLCRLAGAEPYYYAEHHMTHHSKFGTKEDGEFLNFVIPRRYWLTFLPLAAIFNFSDFIIHRPLVYTKGRLISGLTSVTYHTLYGLAIYRRFGLAFGLSALAFFPHIGFYFDRLRQYTEHNLMPLDNKNGSRSFGLGFWGLVVGGGPWGQPCHWEHHLVASIPWYQQVMLHRYVVTLLTTRQRKQFLIEPITGFPKLWWRLVRESSAFLERPAQMTAPSAGGSGSVGT
jgi:Fatty acid desaturase